MHNHILILNTPVKDATRYLTRLVAQLNDSPEFRDVPIQILSEGFAQGLPEALRSAGVVYHQGLAEREDALKAVNAQSARYILILAEDETEPRSDSLTLDALEHLKNLRVEAYIVAECVQDENRGRFFRMGANSVLRPVRSYPEMLVRSIAAPGTEKILENLFTHDDDHPRRYDIPLQDVCWSEIVCKLMNRNFGTALGFIDRDGTVFTNPDAGQVITAKALIVLVNYQRLPKREEVCECLGVKA